MILKELLKAGSEKFWQPWVNRARVNSDFCDVEDKVAQQVSYKHENKTNNISAISMEYNTPQ